MKVFKLIYKNLLRHKLRTFLTLLGITITVMSYALLNTVITGWYASAETSSPNRLIVRNSISFIFPLPLSYRDRIDRIPGVTNVSYANWFGGIYIDQTQFFARYAVDVNTFFKSYTEFIPSSPSDFENFVRERNACMIGEKTAAKYKLKIGDIMNIKGDIFPGDWQFVVRAIYRGRDKSTDETAMMLHWDYLNEYIIQHYPGRANQVGWYVVDLKDPNAATSVGEAIDDGFKNSAAETKTETDKQFQMDFISMSGTILTAIRIISYIIIGIILLVLANTMVMTARERMREYAVLKTLGFTTWHLLGLIAGESLAIALTGGVIGLLLTFPICNAIGDAVSTYFPVFRVEAVTVVLAASFSLLVGIIAAIFPMLRAMHTSIVDGLRQIG